MKEFDKAMAEKNALMADAEKCQNKLNMAQRPLVAISGTMKLINIKIRRQMLPEIAMVSLT